MRTLLYLSNKEYVNDMNVDLSEIPSKITLDYLAGLVKDMRHETPAKKIFLDSR